MFTRVVAVLLVAVSATVVIVPSWAAETYKGQVAGVGTVEVELVERGTPTFPRRARSYGVSGSVMVRFSVDVEGNAIGAVIVESKPRRMFDRSAMRYMETLKFAPYLVDGKATQVIDVKMTVAYVIEGG
ncbi:MAG: energy transducer TonB [Pseudomonadota bacterium]|nr:energy transducer TonB [Pseudomonadota bacterium]